MRVLLLRDTLLHDNLSTTSVIGVDGWINAHGKDVLMVLCENSRRHDIAIVARLAIINADGADNTCCARFDRQATGKIELVCEDVFIVVQSSDELDDELSVARYHSSVGSEVGVLPEDAIVLFVQTHRRGQLRGFTVRFCKKRIKIVDGSQAITAKL